MNAKTTATNNKLVPDQPTLASAFIGRSVYSSADPESDNIGDVNDLIIERNGEITRRGDRRRRLPRHRREERRRAVRQLKVVEETATCGWSTRRPRSSSRPPRPSTARPTIRRPVLRRRHMAAEHRPAHGVTPFLARRPGQNMATDNAIGRR